MWIMEVSLGLVLSGYQPSVCLTFSCSKTNLKMMSHVWWLFREGDLPFSGLKYNWSLEYKHNRALTAKQATDIHIDLHWYWSSYMIGTWAHTVELVLFSILFTVCSCLCRSSVTSTPWAEGPPSSPVELWVSLSPFVTRYFFFFFECKYV